MEYEKYKFRVGEIEYDVIHCLGHGQCQCDSCKQRGRYNVSWTSWFYKLEETDEHVLCSDCMTEVLVQRRIAAETEQLDPFPCKMGSGCEAAGQGCYDCPNNRYREQIVKDTAKEILDELDLFFKGTTFRKGYEFKKIDQKLKEIARRKGVED